MFLSIGYSTCHWCHVMAHECFEDEEVADILNRLFVSVKVDREERPDVDAIYMQACQAFTGSGGWPLSVFLTPAQKPFFAGTYFPKEGKQGQMGFMALLLAIAGAWQGERASLLDSADKLVDFLAQQEAAQPQAETDSTGALPREAADWLSARFDTTYGGFGAAPKFPMGHQLVFLLEYARATGEGACLGMAEKTLAQMYKGGLFDHIGHGFCRYSTDRRFLVPHFEKMLYDNALLIQAYGKAYAQTARPFYSRAARETADYVLREMRGPAGGFYSAQDADSEGEEGKYYLLTYEEILSLLGEEKGAPFCAYYGISPLGNFEGKSIPNLLHDPPPQEGLEALRKKVYEYRLGRCPLHLDDKYLCAWNGLMIAALAGLSQTLGEERYLKAARDAEAFLRENLMQGDSLRVSWRDAKQGAPGFLEDYAFYGLGLIALYDATFEEDCLVRALGLAKAVLRDFYDPQNGGFYLSGRENERLILSTKPTYDGALPSGNSAMAHLLQGLALRTVEPDIQAHAERQMEFMAAQANGTAAGYCFFLSALLAKEYPPDRLVCVLENPAERAGLRERIPLGWAAAILDAPQAGYGLLHSKTTFYACKGNTCLPPTTELEEAL